MENNLKRINYLDSAKGIGIILVCIGHSITNAQPAGNSDCRILLQFISQFHMPLFFLLSGMVFSDKYVENPVKSSLKKFKAYYIPFVVYNMIFVIMHNLMFRAHIFTESYDIKSYIKTIINVLTLHIQDICGAMWFLRCLLTIVILFIWIRYIACRICGGKYSRYITAFIVAAMLIFSMSGLCPSVFRIELAFYYMAFYYMGYLIRRFDLSALISRYKMFLIITGLIINVIVAFNYTYAIGGACENYVLILKLVVQIIGSIMILALVQLKPLADCRLLIELGKKSLDIMALHFVCFKIVSFVIICVYGLDMTNMSTIPVVIGVNGLWPLAYTIVGLIIPAAIRNLYDRIIIKIKKV